MPRSLTSVDAPDINLPAHAGRRRRGQYLPEHNVFNFKASNFRRTRRGMARAAGDGRMEILVVGDSLGISMDEAITPLHDETSYPRQMTSVLASALGAPMRPGIQPVNMGYGAYITDRWSFTGTVNASAVGFITMSPGSTAKHDFQYPGTEITIVISGLSGAFTYQIDGGTPVAGSPSGASAWDEVIIVSGLEDTTHSVTIAASGTVYLNSVALDDGVGITLHNLCWGGSQANHGDQISNWLGFTSDPGSLNFARKQGLIDNLGLDPDLFIINIGMNDISTGDTVSNAIAGAETMRNWFPDADFAFVSGWELPGSPAGMWDQYTEAKYELAEELDVALFDWRDRVGEAADMAADQLIISDGVHPDPGLSSEFGRSIASLLAGSMNKAQTTNIIETLNGTQDIVGEYTVWDDGTSAGDWPERLVFWYDDDSESPRRVFYLNEYGEVRLAPANPSTIAMRLFTRETSSDPAHNGGVPVFQIMDDRTSATQQMAIHNDGTIEAPNVINGTVTWETGSEPSTAGVPDGTLWVEYEA